MPLSALMSVIELLVRRRFVRLLSPLVPAGVLSVDQGDALHWKLA